MRTFSARPRPRSASLAGILPALLAVGLAVGLAGCQQLFTTSLAKALARSELPIPTDLTDSEAADLAAQAKANQDTKLATSLVASLLTEIGTTSNPALEASAAGAAIVASGVGSTLTSLISTNSSTTIDSATLISLLGTVQAGATTNVVTALSFLSDPAVLADPSASGLGATDLAMAAIVIAASALPAGVDPSTLSGVPLTTFQASPEFHAASAIIASAASMATPGASADLLAQMQSFFSL